MWIINNLADKITELQPTHVLYNNHNSLTTLTPVLLCDVFNAYVKLDSFYF